MGDSEGPEDHDRGSELSPEQAFKLLGNETRLDILLALWEARRPWEGSRGVPFSELFHSVGIDDSGQFNYHLDKLVGHFVRHADDGYELTNAGFAVVQAVIAGTGIDAPTLEPTALDDPCPRCGHATELAYEHGTAAVYCTHCDGFWATGRDAPAGYLVAWTFPPAGLRDRTPEGIRDATLTHLLTRSDAMLYGVCPDCGGTVETRLDVCTEHDPGDGICDACARRHLGFIAWTCNVCKLATGAPSWAPVVYHPAVVAFLYARDVDYHRDPWKTVNVGYHQGWEEELLSDEPLRLRITVRAAADDDALQVTLDESGTVVDVTQ